VTQIEGTHMRNLAFITMSGVSFRETQQLPENHAAMMKQNSCIASKSSKKFIRESDQ
jgi:hypothetical protein